MCLVWVLIQYWMRGEISLVVILVVRRDKHAQGKGQAGNSGLLTDPERSGHCTPPILPHDSVSA